MMQDPDGAISEYAKIGVKYIAIPYLTEEYRPGHKKFGEVIEGAKILGNVCKKYGIRLLYHNHDFEFVQLSGLYGLDFLYEATDADILQTELDVCWVKYAGEDPVSYLRKYAGRAPVVHLKDYVGKKGEGTPYALIGQSKKEDENVPFEFRPFGHGCQDAKAVVNAAIEANAQWLVVEQDLWYQRTPMEAAKMSIDTLYEIGVKQR